MRCGRDAQLGFGPRPSLILLREQQRAPGPRRSCTQQCGYFWVTWCGYPCVCYVRRPTKKFSKRAEVACAKHLNFRNSCGRTNLINSNCNKVAASSRSAQGQVRSFGDVRVMSVFSESALNVHVAALRFRATNGHVKLCAHSRLAEIDQIAALPNVSLGAWANFPSAQPFSMRTLGTCSRIIDNRSQTDVHFCRTLFNVRPGTGATARARL